MRTYFFIYTILLLLVSQNLFSQKDLMWSANDHFNLNETNNSIEIKIEKLKWECFTLIISEQDISENPFISFKIKSDSNIDLRVDVLDKTNINQTIDPIIKKIPLGNNFVGVKYDFGKLKDVIDLKKIRHFQFFVNPGKKHIGTISIKDVVIGKTIENEFNSSKPLITFFPNPIINHLTINSKVEKFDEIKIMDALGVVVFSKRIPPSNIEIFHVETLSQGLFFLEVKQEGKGIYSNSFVRQKN